MQNGDVSPQLSYTASLSPGSSLKHVKQTPGAMKRSWPGATPVALEPWHLWRKVSGQALWDLACKWCHLSDGTPRLLHSCSNSHSSSSAFFCKTAEQIQAGRCRGASRQSLVQGRLGEPERKDASPHLSEVYAQGLLCEPRKGWENWLQAQQFPFWCTLDNPGFQGVDEGSTARIVTRSMLKKARISMTN